MNPHFAAGFFAAWSAIYVAASFYGFWGSRRKSAEADDLPLALFCTSQALFGGAAAVFLLEEHPDRGTLAFATVASLAAPAILYDLSISIEGSAADVRSRRAAYVIFAALAIASAAHALHGPAPTAASLAALALVAPGSMTPVTTIAKVFSAALVAFVTYREARLFIRARRGLGAFLGSVVLSVTVTHDAGMSIAGGSSMSLATFGYDAFAVGLFMSQIVRFAARRDRLIQKTRELSERSSLLTTAFKELRAAQSELVRKEQLAAIGELSAVVAHEVRNPLAVIANAVAALRREGVSLEDRETLLKILEEETSRLNQLVGDLLHYARPLAPESQLVPIRELVDRAIAPARARPDIGVDIVEPEAVGRVGGDPMLLRQAIDNVVNNAVQAMPGGGTLTVVLERRGQGPEERVAISISDTGEGMDTVVRKRALDPFFTTRPAGTGLGLAIVARVVDAHGGELTIRSAPGAGTEVGIALPIEPRRAREPRRSLLSLTRGLGIQDGPSSENEAAGEEAPQQAVPSE